MSGDRALLAYEVGLAVVVLMAFGVPGAIYDFLIRGRFGRGRRG